MFGDTFKTVKSLSESVYQVPKSVQQSIPIYRISQNGIFEIEKKNGEHVFDKAYVLEDVNYSTKDEEEKEEFLLALCKVFNSMNIDFKFLVINQRRDVERLLKELMPDEQTNPLYKSMIEAYCQVLRQRLQEGNTSIEQMKYLVVSCKKTDFESARIFFVALEQRLHILFHSIGGKLIPMDGIGRLRSLHSIYRLGHEQEFHLTWQDLRKTKRNWQNEICNLSLIHI